MDLMIIDFAACQTRIAMCSCHGKGALNILQLWASRGQTREPILTKLGRQQQVRTTMSHAIKYSNF